MHQTAELKIAPPPAAAAPGRAGRQAHLYSGGPLLTSMSTSSPQVPSAMNAESFFCEEMLSWDFSAAAAARCSVVTDHRAWSALCLQRVFNILPAPLHDHIKVWEGRREGARGRRRRCVLETTTRRHREEDSDSQRETDREGKKTILSLSLLGFFVLFHSLC